MASTFLILITVLVYRHRTRGERRTPLPDLPI